MSPKLFDALDEVMLDIAGRESNHTKGLGLPDAPPLISSQQTPDHGLDLSTSAIGSQQDLFFDSNDIISFAGKKLQKVQLFYNRGLKLSFIRRPHYNKRRVHGPHIEEKCLCGPQLEAKSAFIVQNIIVLSII